jgi:hypothetical protein
MFLLVLEFLLQMIVIASCLFTFRSKIELGDVTPHNIKQLKRLNQVVFPVSYNDKFYKDVLEAGELAKLGIVLNEVLTKTICYGIKRRCS